ncbi:MAG TPA: phytoene/squalene synthase family protein [Stellaceae bacterium]|nr:phytoene/squalene synthase family protein [Stellaceae bacterium]
MSPVAALVREHDRDRFQTALFAPAAQREAVFALYAFNYEIARIREAVREEMLGRIRLQWWREAIDAAFSGQPPRRHDVIEALGRAINRYDLTQAHFERLIEAREEDLAAGPPPTLAALEDYCAASSARLVDLAAEILGAREAAEAARGVGIAYGLTGLLRAMPYHAAIGRSYIPEEFAVAPADYRNRRASPELHAAVAGIADLAARHLHAARARRDGVPRSALAAFLPAVIAGRYLVRLKRAAFDPFDPALAVPDALQSWRLLAASLRGRF